MNSMFITSIPVSIIEEARQGKDLLELIHDNCLYRTSFEHYWYEHNKFLQRQRLGDLQDVYCSDDLNEIDRIIHSPFATVRMVKKFNHVDLNKLEEKANKYLGKHYDADMFMSIIKNRIIAILNHAAEHGDYLMIDYG